MHAFCNIRKLHIYIYYVCIIYVMYEAGLFGKLCWLRDGLRYTTAESTPYHLFAKWNSPTFCEKSKVNNLLCFCNKYMPEGLWPQVDEQDMWFSWKVESYTFREQLNSQTLFQLFAKVYAQGSLTSTRRTRHVVFTKSREVTLFAKSQKVKYFSTCCEKY